ncbi:glycosyltransferase family 2 protein [Vibrio vulnificus]|uniref:glycosyltransferase family 2 protein n=1 Tax=Vibrio vulnificus TaxID=672 RepID=UPI003EDA41B9
MINIFILNWNSTNDIDGLLNSLTLSNNKVFRVILIHNGTDDWNELVDLSIKYSSEFEIHVVNNGDNLGYAGGNNAGFEYLINNNLDGDILISNPDVKVLPTTLDVIKYELSSSQNVGAIMIRTLDEKGHLMYDKIKLNGLKQVYINTNELKSDTDYVAGSFFIVRRDIIENIGLFEPLFFMYWEEVDLSKRIKDIGYRLISVTGSYVVRKSNPKSRSLNSIYYSTRNAFLMFYRHESITIIHLIKYLISMFFISFVKVFKEFNIKYLLSFILGVKRGIGLVFFNSKNPS